MICPTCKGTMTYLRADVSHGDDGTAYDREFYRCANDDVWITLETPRATE